jgi:hypothetical protein
MQMVITALMTITKMVIAILEFPKLMFKVGARFNNKRSVHSAQGMSPEK